MITDAKAPRPIVREPTENGQMQTQVPALRAGPTEETPNQSTESTGNEPYLQACSSFEAQTDEKSATQVSAVNDELKIQAVTLSEIPINEEEEAVALVSTVNDEVHVQTLDLSETPNDEKPISETFTGSDELQMQAFALSTITFDKPVAEAIRDNDSDDLSMQADLISTITFDKPVAEAVMDNDNDDLPMQAAHISKTPTQTDEPSQPFMGNDELHAFSSADMLKDEPSSSPSPTSTEEVELQLQASTLSTTSADKPLAQAPIDDSKVQIKVPILSPIPPNECSSQTGTDNDEIQVEVPILSTMTPNDLSAHVPAYNNQMQTQIPTVSAKSTEKWYCARTGCRKLNFPPSAVCIKCKAVMPGIKAEPQPLQIPNASGTTAEAQLFSKEKVRQDGDGTTPINSSLRLLEPICTPVFDPVNQYEIGPNGKPRIRRALPLIINLKTEVTVSWVESLTEFYVVRVDDMPDLLKIENATSEASEWSDVVDPCVGDSCLCLEEGEDYCSWYRARILGLGKASYKIQFTDFGNKNMNYRGSLKCLPLEWMNYPELAKKVRLNVADMIKSPENAVENFKMLIHGKVCWFTASSYDPERQCYVGSLAVDGIQDKDITPALKGAITTASSPTPTSSLLPESESDSQESGTTGSVEVSSTSTEGCQPSAYAYTVDKLHRPVLQPGDKREFSITYAVGFDHFYVRSAERDTKQHLFQLNDALNEYMLEARKTASLPVDPAIGEVYIVTQPVINGTPYFRGVVEKVTKEKYCQMRNVDNGHPFSACLRDLTRISEAIFQIPALAYQVKLSGFANSPNLIFQKDFDEFIRKLQIGKEVFKINVDGLVESISTATLKFKGGGLLVTKILELRKWTWEHLYDMGARTDEEIIQKETNGYGVESEIVDLDVPLKMDVEAIVRGVEPMDHDKKLPRIMLEPITKYTRELKEAFRHQVKSYIKKIRASNYFPGYGDMVFVLPPEGHPGAGEWQRCLRACIGSFDALYCVDTYVVYPTDVTSGFTYRKVIPDFMRIPALVASGELDDPDHDIFTTNCMLKTFVVGRKVTVKFLKKADVNLFTFESYDLKETMRQELENSSVKPHK